MSEFLIFLQIVMMILFIIYLFNSNKNNYSKVNIIDKENIDSAYFVGMWLGNVVVDLI